LDRTGASVVGKNGGILVGGHRSAEKEDARRRSFRHSRPYSHRTNSRSRNELCLLFRSKTLNSPPRIPKALDKAVKPAPTRTF
jgi:hypothetical protein